MLFALIDFWRARLRRGCVFWREKIEDVNVVCHSNRHSTKISKFKCLIPILREYGSVKNFPENDLIFNKSRINSPNLDYDTTFVRFPVQSALDCHIFLHCLHSVTLPKCCSSSLTSDAMRSRGVHDCFGGKE